jgi:hypothetical protein
MLLHRIRPATLEISQAFGYPTHNIDRAAGTVRIHVDQRAASLYAGANPAIDVM